jgi:PAS domain S-box-containing protein
MGAPDASIYLTSGRSGALELLTRTSVVGRAGEDPREGALAATAWEIQDCRTTGPDAGPVLAAAPLRSDTRALGVIVLAYAPERTSPLGEAELRCLDGLARLAGIGFEQAVRSEEERRARNLAERLAAAARALSGTISLRETLDRMLTELQSVVAYDSASVQELRGSRMEIIGGHGFSNLEELIGLGFDVDGDNPNGAVVRTLAPVIVDDAPTCYADFSSEPHTKAGSIRSFLGVPLLVRGTLIGMVALDRKEPGFFTEEHAATAMAFASQAAVAIERARLYDSLQREIAVRAAAEATAREREARLAEAQRIAQVGSWEWRLDTDSMWASDEALRILGVAPGAIGSSRSDFFSRIHADDQPVVNAAHAAALASERPYSASFRIVRPDGAVRFVHSWGELVRDPAGRPLRIVGTLQDLTQGHEAEENLAILSSALEQTADHVFVTDREGRILYANPAFERHTGFTREEIVGTTPRILKSGRHPPEFYEGLWTSLVAGEVFRGVVVNGKKSGELYYEDKTIAPIRDPGGRITHFVSVGRDITDRRHAEEAQARLQQAISRSALEWRATFDAVDSPILIVDAQGRISRPNRAARDLAGKPYSAIMGCRVEEAGEGPLWTAFARASEAALSGTDQASRSVEDASSGRTWDVGASPLAGEGASPTGAIVLARDVTDLVRLQDSLRRSETMAEIGRFVAGVAHEVRNPLFGISATVDAMELEFGGREEFREFGAHLRDEVERLSALMQDLLEYGGPRPAQLARDSLADVLVRARGSCGTSGRTAGVTVRIEAAPDLPQVDIDRQRMVLVFKNLIENAIQHSPAGSEVVVRARVSDEARLVECAIEDSGPGFRDEDLPRVFEPFFTRRKHGTGLGLAIAYSIVLGHGGEVVARNRAQGGAAVVVRLPLPAPPGH